MTENLTIVNLMPHELTLHVTCPVCGVLSGPWDDMCTWCSGAGITNHYPSKGVARVTSETGALIKEVGRVPLYQPPTMGDVVGLPEPVEGTIYVVSGMVSAALRSSGSKRLDVASPGTGPGDGAVRNADGQIKAVTRLIMATDRPLTCLCGGSRVEHCSYCSGEGCEGCGGTGIQVCEHCCS